MKKDPTTVYCLRCGLRFYAPNHTGNQVVTVRNGKAILTWCQCWQEPKKSRAVTVAHVPIGIAFTTQEQKQ